MKKLASLLLVFIILAQLGWLSVRYDTLSHELNTAPHIIIRVDNKEFYLSSFWPAKVVRQVTADDAFFGKSLWWDTRWQGWINGLIYNEELSIEGEETHITSPNELANTFPLRPQPGEEVTGALEIKPNVGYVFAGFWKKGEDGLWELCRIEAIDSSEDKAREGEQRLYVKMSMDEENLTVSRQGDKLVLKAAWEFTPCAEDKDIIGYSMPERRDNLAVNQWCTQHPEAVLAVKVILRTKRPPLCQTLLIDGKPVAELIREIRKESKVNDDEDEVIILPPPTEEVTMCAEMKPAEPTSEPEQPQATQEEAPAPEPTPEPEQPQATQ